MTKQNVFWQEFEAMLRQEKEQKERIMEQTRFYVKDGWYSAQVRVNTEEKRLYKNQEKENSPRSKVGKKDKIQMKIDEKEWTELQAYLKHAMILLSPVSKNSLQIFQGRL